LTPLWFLVPEAELVVGGDRKESGVKAPQSKAKKDDRKGQE